MMLRYETIVRSAGLKKFISAAVIAANGDGKELWAPMQLPFPLGIAIGGTTLTNGSGSTAVCGLAGRLPQSLWAAGQVTAAGVYTADTEDAQDVGTGDFSMHDRTDSGSGFLVGASIPFSILGIVQSAAGDQTAPVKIVEYWNGTSWIDMVAGLHISDTLNGSGTGEKVLCWGIPSDWVVGGTGTGVPSTSYNIRVRHTHGGAGTANPVASQLFVGVAQMVTRAVADGDGAALVSDGEFFFPRQCDALFPVFSVAGFGNQVETRVRGY